MIKYARSPWIWLSGIIGLAGLVMIVYLVGRYEFSMKWKSATPEQRHEIYANNDKYISDYLIGKSHSVVNDFLGPPDKVHERTQYTNEINTWTYDLGYSGITINEEQYRYNITIQYNYKWLVDNVEGHYIPGFKCKYNRGCW
jgi:hypothetical protein